MSSTSSHQEIETDILPKHLAIIMDGNGRWAKARGKPRVFGHKAGVDAVRKTVKTANRLGLKVLTLFAFSSENWQRPEDEVQLLMDLFLLVLNREVKRLHKHNVKLHVIGDTSRFSASLRNKITAAEQLTANNTGLILNIAANYGGKWDILQSVKSLALEVEKGNLLADQITEASINASLLTHELPDVDLMIRTSGECRISNFMLWQAAYAELYFTEQLWPDFGEQALLDAVAWFTKRERRFGCTSEQLKAMLQVEK